MAFPLTKSLNSADIVRGELLPYIGMVAEEYLAGQHVQRRWEYAQALRAWYTWRLTPAGQRSQHEPWHVADVGGAGSLFHNLLERATGDPVLVVDPLLNTTLETAPIIPGTIDALFSISVIEHVPNPLGFLKAAADALVPGGLLFLTTDCWDSPGPDTAHFHWMRERIYTMAAWQALAQTGIDSYGLQLLGGADWTYHGDQLFGSYSFASLAMTKGGSHVG